MPSYYVTIEDDPDGGSPIVSCWEPDESLACRGKLAGLNDYRDGSPFNECERPV
jgi:hypothetical protein